MTCANPRYPNCKHAKAAHIPGGCDQCLIAETCNQYMEGDMSNKTVDVKVSKPPEGKEWYGWHSSEGEIILRLRRIAPPERMVAVMMTESDRQHWASYDVPPASRGPQGTPAARLFDAARKA